MKLLSFDPSGNWGAKEGWGTTGWSVFIDGKLSHWGHIKAEKFITQEEYWAKHRDLIEMEYPETVLIESYKLFEHKAQSQSWSTLDTPALIGFLRMVCHDLLTPVVFQDPAQKAGVNDARLEKLGYLEKRGRSYYINNILTIIHERDSIRHGIYYYRYGKGKQELEAIKANNIEGLQ